MGEQYDEEGMRRVAWAHRKERMRKQKRKQMLFRRLAKVAGAVAAVLVLVLVVKGMMHEIGRASWRERVSRCV